ncbi:MAG: flagellar export protein FliJ [Pirellulales bacterium]|nr:flagellar export protein FliJ [Pirellulales bacterium]
MPPFQFRLQTLLRLREADRDDKRAELAAALQAEEIVHERVRALDRETAATRQASRQELARGTVNVDTLVERQRYEYQLTAERAATEQQRQLILAEIEQRRERLARADQEVRVLERLRENQWEQWRAGELRGEQQLFDELALRVSGQREIPARQAGGD